MKLALGTAQFGMDYGISNSSGRVTLNEANEVIKRSREYGMDTLDTAISYGDSEASLGNLDIAQWKIITKLPAVPDECSDVKEWVINQIQQSMIRMRIKQLYGVLLHRPNQLMGQFGLALYEALLNIKSLGLASKIGVSIYETTELDVLLEFYHFDIIQAPLNILDRRILESGWASQLHNAGVELHTRSVFLQGLLLMTPSQRPIKFQRWNETWSTWDSWINREGLTRVQACLRFAANLSTIKRVIVGVDSITQLNQILEAVDGKLTNLPDFDSLKDLRLINPASWS